MSESADLRSADLDGLIRWLDKQRRQDTTTPLGQLVAEQGLDPARLIDLACVDLMQRRRMGHAVRVEDYLKDIPALSKPELLLDLIDAELCVAAELKQATSSDDYVGRFPELANEIRELIQLESGIAEGHRSNLSPLLGDEAELTPQGNEHSDASGLVESLPPESSLEGELQFADGSKELVSSLQEDVSVSSFLSEQPVEAPEWFVADQCVARTPGRWLLRGHESVRRTPLAMKVTELPLQLDAAQSHALLDACEAASKVRNPRWISPRVAAVQQRHLGVVRDWSFSQPWNAVDVEWRVQAKRLADIAYTVEAAHRAGATHGGLHFGNILVDHSGDVLLVDGAASHAGVNKWCHGISSGIRSFEERVQIDLQDLVKLISASVVDWKTTKSRALLNAIQHVAADHAEACGQIGHWLTQCVDGDFDEGRWEPPTRTRWSERWKRWFSANAD